MLDKAAIAAVPAPKADEVRFLGLPTWIRGYAPNTEGRLTLVEQVIPAGFESPGICTTPRTSRFTCSRAR